MITFTKALRLLLVLHPVVLCMSLGAQTPYPLEFYGQGGSGVGDYKPTFHTQGQFPILGNKEFQLISRNLPGGTTGFLWLSLRKANLPIPGMTWWVDPINGFGLTLSASGRRLNPGTGQATVSLPVPHAPELCWAPFFLQGFFIEETYPYTSYLWTRGLVLNFQKSFPKEQTALYDREAYSTYITTATRGKALWNAIAIPGFSYGNTVKCSSGGKTHWMVVVKDKTYNIEFVLIPGGSFRMGDITNQGGLHHEQEIPIHWVHIQPFLLARAEITQAQWTAVMKTTPWKGLNYAGPQNSHAANYLNWNDIAQGASSFCGKLGWRPPSEAEWEYACRAGTSSTFHYGGTQADTPPGSPTGPCPSASYPHQPGTQPANAFGLFDVDGNLWEWCQDKWQSNYKGAPVDGSAWESGTTTYRVFRGGCWDFRVPGCRSADRYRDDPAYRGYCYGFRPAVDIR